MRGDGGGVQVGGAGVVRVGVRLVQTGGVGAEGAVDEEVAGRAERRPSSRGLVDVLLRPVADDARAGLLGGEPQQVREVVLGGDLRPPALVDGADAEGGGVGEGGALGLGALRGRHGCERRGADGVVRVAGERPPSAWPAAVRRPATRSSRAVVTTAEWTSIAA